MTEFKSVEIYDFPRSAAQITEDNLYWKNLGFPIAFKEFGAVDFIDFSHQDPHNAAVTSSAKVEIYNTVSNKLQSSLSRFKKSAYGGVFRRDGKLLVAGSEDGFLRLFDIDGNRLLRIFKGHKAATHRCNFTMDGVHLISFSDDQTVALWDIPTETRLTNFEEHKDYVRAGAVSHVSQDLFISGSYDHTVKMYDVRSGTSVISMDHGVPVESVLMFPSGGLFVSAGGTSMKVWDPVAGRMLTQVQQHHKTITCLCFASGGRRIMSGSLDRHVKIYDTVTYDVVHTLNYSAPILSVSAAPQDVVIGVGMTDGLFSLQHKKTEKLSDEKKKKKNTSYQYHSHGTDFRSTDEDVVVPQFKKRIYKKYETCLKQFNISKALDTVLKDRIQDDHPEITMSILMELIRRDAIRAAMADREGESLTQLLKFVTRYIGDLRFQRVLIDIADILMELYGPKLGNPEVRKLFLSLYEEVIDQDNYMKELLEVQVLVETVLMHAAAQEQEDTLYSFNTEQEA